MQCRSQHLEHNSNTKKLPTYHVKLQFYWQLTPYSSLLRNKKPCKGFEKQWLQKHLLPITHALAKVAGSLQLLFPFMAICSKLNNSSKAASNQEIYL